MMTRTSLKTGGLLVVLLLAGSCATRQRLTGQEVKGFDKKLSTYAYIEEGDIVTLIVDTLPARDKDGSDFVPFQIAIANTGTRVLALTLESFTLIDKDGNRYPAANARELLEGYDMLNFDRNLGELRGIVYNKFATLQAYPSNFSPTQTAEIAVDSVVRDLVALPKHGYFIDFIYFPMPKTGIRDQPFELFVESPNLEDPVFVKFEVR